MADVAKSDIFFVITTLAVAVLSILGAVLLVYVLFIVRNLKRMMEHVKKESDLILEDVHDLRMKLKEDGGAVRRASAVFMFFKKTFFGKRKR